MSRPKFLLQRGNTYHFRRPVPKELHGILGKTEWKKSLKTKNYDEAVHRVGLAVVETNHEIKQANRKAKQVATELEVEQIVKQWFFERDEHNAAEDVQNLNKLSDGMLAETLTYIQADLEAYGNKQLWDNTDRKNWAKTKAAKLITRFKLSLPQDHPNYEKMLFAILRADKELLERRYDRLSRSDFSGAVHDTHFSTTPQIITPSTSATSDITLGELVEEYLKAKEHSVTPRTFHSYKAHCELLMNFFSKDTKLSSITRSRMKEVAEKLKQYPVNAKQKYPNLSPDMVIAKAQKNGDKLFSAKNHAYYTDSFSSLFSYAEEEDYIAKNVAKKLPKAPKSLSEKKKRYPFTLEQLNYITQNMPHWKWQGGVPRDALWVPIICLYTGMRVTECCQLHVEDIKTDEGITYFDITPTIDPDEEAEAENVKHLKTSAAKRKVPMHSRLLELGLMRRVEQAKKAGEVRVLSQLPPKDNYRRFRDWFNRNVKKVQIDGKPITFHSTRHTARDEMDNCGIDFEMRHALGGWQLGYSSSEAVYGIGKNLSNKKEAIEKLRYEGLDLSAVEGILHGNLDC